MKREALPVEGGQEVPGHFPRTQGLPSVRREAFNMLSAMQGAAYALDVRPPDCQ